MGCEKGTVKYQSDSNAHVMIVTPSEWKVSFQDNVRGVFHQTRNNRQHGWTRNDLNLLIRLSERDTKEDTKS